MAETSVALDIEFLDPPGDLDTGEEYRFRVIKRGAAAHNQHVEISQLDFVLRPNTWGHVEATDDPYVAVLKVVELVDSRDIYELPDYSIAAMLKAQGARVLRPKRQSRMAARRVEVELLFLHGYPGHFERFDPWRGIQPSDPQRSFKLASDKQQIVVRDGKIFLQCESLEDLRTCLECKMPGGEVVSCDLEAQLESGAAWQNSEPYGFPSYEEQRQQQPEFQRTRDSRPVRLDSARLEDLRSHWPDTEVVEERPFDLEIDYLDPIGDMVPGEEVRFQVRFADQVLDVDRLHIEFQPVLWAALEDTGDPQIGRLRILELPRPADIYERPEYWLNVSLRAFGQSSVSPRRMIRLIPGEVFLELLFYRGHADVFELFNPLTAKRPLNLREGTRVSHERGRFVNREDQLYLHFDRLCDMPSVSEVSLPNGETMRLVLDSQIQNGTLSRSVQAVQAETQRKPAPRSKPPNAAPKPCNFVEQDQDDQTDDRVRQRLRQLRVFIVSFQTKKSRPSAEQVAQIRQRISAQVKQTRDRLELYKGPKQQEFWQAFEDCLKLIPEALKDKQHEPEARSGG